MNDKEIAEKMIPFLEAVIMGDALEYKGKISKKWYPLNLRNLSMMLHVGYQIRIVKKGGIEMTDRCTLTDEQLIQAVRDWNSKLCNTGGKAWVLSIPARFDKDPDCLIEELVERFEKLIKKEESK